MPDDSVDVLVLGAGPAGSTIARLLAGWGYSVVLLRGPASRTALAESLPPSIDNVFEVAGIRAEIERAGFYPDCGNTSWWGTAEPRIEGYAPGRKGYHVDRQVFDDLLVSFAERVGAVVRRNSRAPRVALAQGAIEHDSGVTSARFVIDATGRTGLLARQIQRNWDQRYRTLALSGIFRSHSAWKVSPHHTLVEAYDRGWAWSVPLADNRRQVSFMVDTGGVRGGIEPAYAAELARSVHFRRLFEDCELESAPWGRDASLYYAERYAGPNWMLVGDAGSFVDPLSSFGVKKAMLSAWTGAVVVNTCLSKPELAEAAIGMFNARESETWLDHARQASRYFAQAAAVFHTSFWKDRSTPPDTVLYRHEELEAALEGLRRAGSFNFVLTDGMRYEHRPVIRGREVVLAARPVLAGLRNTEYMQGVHLTTLAMMAPGYSTAGELYEGYVQRSGETPLPNFLAALSLLMASNILEIRSSSY